MTPERARPLAHRVPESRAALRRGTVKQREIRFTPMPPGQTERAIELLAGLEYLIVSGGPHPHGITVTYDLVDYSFQGLERALRNLGYHLDNALHCKIVRALVYFSEKTQLRKLMEPARYTARRT